MTHWALFSLLASGLFYGLYMLLFRRDHWLQLSRVYLLATLAFSLLYPTVRMPEVDIPLLSFDIMALPEIDIEASGVDEASPILDTNRQSESVWSWLPLAVYLAGVAVSIAVLAVQLIRMARAIRRLPRQSKSLHLLDDNTPPCSFFNHIILGTDRLDDRQQQCILVHEQLHVRQRHTLDVLLMRTMCCAAWFNPFAWLMLRELRAVHEYLADEAVLATHGREGYLGLLYREATGLGYGHITNNFQSINIKNRIAMMNRKKSRFGAWKLLAALPVTAVLMLVGCKPVEAAPTTGGYGNTVLTVNYHREGGKQQPFGKTCYNHVHSEIVKKDFPLIFNVTCSGEGAIASYGTWELSDIYMSGGRVLNRYEKKVIKAVDRQLRNGIAEGSLSRTTTVRAVNGRTRLLFTATWHNGKPNGDADITLTISEVGSATVPPADAAIYDEPDTNPEFVGGTDSLYHFLAANIHYPEQAKKDGIQGRVFVRFTVEADGSVADAKVMRGIGGGCDEEALRVVQAMPRWKPGTKDGHPVRVQYNLPINFILNEQNGK